MIAISKQRSNRVRIILTIILLLIVIGAIALFLLTQGIRNAPIPLGVPTGEIAFISDRGGSWDIFLLNAEGELTNLTTEESGATAADYFPSWSFDSQRINFLSNRTGETGPTQVSPDGTSVTSLSIINAVLTVVQEQRFDWDATWSPGAERRLWSSLRDLNLELYLIDEAAEFTPENATRLTEDGGRDWFHTWSPDGTSILFSSDREGNENIYRLDVGTGELRQLTNTPHTELHPMWTIDGEKILYVSEAENSLDDGAVDLYVMNPDGSDQRPIAEGEIYEVDPIWSPDGTAFLYVSNADGHWHLFSQNADGSNVQRLTEGENNNLFPVWRP